MHPAADPLAAPEQEPDAPPVDATVRLRPRDTRPTPAARSMHRFWSTVLLYVGTGVLTFVVTAVMLRLWRATWSAPFYFAGDAVSSAAHFKTTLVTGWYESQPDLGFPYGQHYHDFPFADDLHPFVIKLLGVFSSDWPVVFNLYYVLGYVLAGLSGLWFLRRVGLRPPLAVVLAVLFAVAPYHLVRSEGHFFLGEYYCIPFGIWIAVAAARGEPLWGLRRFRSGWPSRAHPVVRTVVGIATGRGIGTVVMLTLVVYDGAYYGVFTAVLLAAGALAALFRDRDGRRFLGAVVAGATLLAAMFAAMVPDILYNLAHPGANALARTVGDSDRYATKLTALLLPVSGHPLPAFAAFRRWYDVNYPILGEDAALGLLASIGFVALLLLPFGRMLRARRVALQAPSAARTTDTLLALSVLTWAGLLSCTIGGLGTVLSFLTSSIRGWNRMSIFLGLLALAGLGLLLQARLDRRTPSRRRNRIAVPALCALLLVGGAADQDSILGVPDYTTTTDIYRVDAEFFAQVQAQLPAGAAVFQAPYHPFPEGGLGAADSRQLVPYLLSNGLKWSGGGMKGRPQINWQGGVSNQRGPSMVRSLAVVGFSAVLVEEDIPGARDMDQKLTAVLGPPVLVHPRGEWKLYSLAGPVAAVRAGMTPAQQQAAAAAITHIG